MLYRAAVTVAAGFLSLTWGVDAGVYEYFSGNDFDPTLSLSRCVATKDLTRLKEASDEFRGGTLVLPTDAAWERDPRSCAWYKALADEANADLRQDLMLETGTSVPGEWNSLKQFVSTNDNIIDAASGNVYYVNTDSQELCISEWDEDQGIYVATKKCSTFELPPLGGAALSDQHIYKLDKVILPTNLEALLNTVVGEDCQPNEKLQC